MDFRKILSYIQSNSLLIMGVSVFLISLTVAIFVLFARKESRKKDKADDNILVCPIRGILKRAKYAANGKYSEEYYTIKLVNFFLRKGYQKEQISFEHTIRI